MPRTRRSPLRALLALAGLALALGGPAAAQDFQPGGPGQGFGFGKRGHVEATLWTRVAGDEVRLALRLRMDPTWHLYHEELGHPSAVGKPTVVTLEGEGIDWSPVRFPEPHQADQPWDDAFVLIHEGTVVLYAAGAVEAGATPGTIRAHVDGLACQDDGTCVPYAETLESSGIGPDDVFAAFPEDLLAAAAAKDLHDGGEADATLWTRREGPTVRAAIEVAITPGWHLYHKEKGNPDGIGKPTVVELEAEGVTWAEVRFPKAHRVDQPGGVWILAHDGTIVLHADGELDEGVEEPGPVSAVIDGLTCKDGDGGACIPYRETLADHGRGPDAAFEEPAEEGGGDGLVAFLGLAVLWGFITLLMPCTYPMIPITISFFTKQAAERHGKVLPLSLAYGLGIVAVFIGIGVVFGSVIIDFATHPVTNLVIGALFVYFALVLFGVVNLQPPRVMLELASKASRTGGFAGVFLMGTTLVVTSFTCTAPFVGSLLSVGAAEKDVGRIALGMGVFGLTMAIPFVLLSLAPGFIQRMPRSGQWMNTFKVFMGFVELAAAFKFFSNADLVWEWGVISRELFLLLWVVIFAVATVYLFGLLPGKRERPGPARVAFAFVVLGFTGYCVFGLRGGEMDRHVMTAMIPNYSGGRLMPAWKEFDATWEMVVDDYDAAREQALDERKLLLVNFTGHT